MVAPKIDETAVWPPAKNECRLWCITVGGPTPVTHFYANLDAVAWTGRIRCCGLHTRYCRRLCSVGAVCVANSARSLLAEALLRHTDPRFEAFSAGSEPSEVDPRTTQALEPVGVDATGLRSKSLSEFAGQQFDLVITVCDNAHEACPVFPGAKEQLHWPFEDPAHAQGTGDEQLSVFRRVRDESWAAIEKYLSSFRDQ